MPTLVACLSCGALKRASSPQCPHCQSAAPTAWLKGALLGLGTLAACGGATVFPAGDSGDAGDAGDSGAAYSTGMDAYGLAPMPDAGPPKSDAGGDGGDSD